MKSRLLTLVMAFSVFFMSQLMTAQKSDAAVALIIKNKTALTIGAIGLGINGGAYGLAALGAFSFNLGSAIAFAVSVVTFGGISLLVLDDKTVADMEFSEMNLDNKNFSIDEIQMYNAELEELNAIRKTMQEEIADKGTLEQANNLWEEYKEMLHPSTVKIAENMATGFANKLERK
jgi:hypothetical protein